jgi:hypothetical protein
MTRHIRLRLGLALTLGGLTSGQAVLAQVHPLLIDSPAASLAKRCDCGLR